MGKSDGLSIFAICSPLKASIGLYLCPVKR
jgi:hypothetical protein